jgi:hypothetical protein
MADSLQNISSQGLRVSSPQNRAQARLLVPDMKNELDRVCRVQHELVLEKLITEIIRITRNQQIDVSGRTSDPTTTDEGEVQSPRCYDHEEQSMRSNQSQYEPTSAMAENCVVPSDQEVYSEIRISGNWQTSQRTYSGSTVTGDPSWPWATCSEGILEAVEHFKPPTTDNDWSLTELAYQNMIPESWDSRALTGVGGWDFASSQRDPPS